MKFSEWTNGNKWGAEEVGAKAAPLCNNHQFHR